MGIDFFSIATPRDDPAQCGHHLDAQFRSSVVWAGRCGRYGRARLLRRYESDSTLVAPPSPIYVSSRRGSDPSSIASRRPNKVGTIGRPPANLCDFSQPRKKENIQCHLDYCDRLSGCFGQIFRINIATVKLFERAIRID
jgi:hypothetical protein